MNYVLYNSIFENIISALIILSVIPSLLISTKELKNDLNNNDNDETITNMNKAKLIIILSYIVFISICFVKLACKLEISSYITLIYYLSFAIVAFRYRSKNMNELTQENKMSLIMVTLLFTIFFSSKSALVYINCFKQINHTLKEYLIIIYLTLKLIFFIFCLMINLSITISNINIVFRKSFKIIKNKVLYLFKKELKIKFFSLKLYKKNPKKYFIPEIILFTLTCPLYLIVNLINCTLFYIVHFMLKILISVIHYISKYLNNSSFIIKRILKVSTILSLSVSYIIIEYNSNIFSNKTENIYSLFATVILIPIIYDSIKNKDK